MSFKIQFADLFDRVGDFDAIVHGVNCQGAMGAGFAAEVKRRYPSTYVQYAATCIRKDLEPGGWCFTHRDRVRMYHAAVKDRWWNGARIDWVRASLDGVFRDAVRNDRPKIAMPWIGCGLDGLPEDGVRSTLLGLTEQYPVEVTVFDLRRGATPSPA